MRRRLIQIAAWLGLLIALAPSAYAQERVMTYSLTASQNGTAANNYMPLTGSGVTQHQIIGWVSGTVTGGTCELQYSNDPVNTQPLNWYTLIAGVSCTSNFGPSTLTTLVVNYVRIHASSAITGTGSVLVYYGGYSPAQSSSTVGGTCANANAVAIFTASTTLGCANIFSTAAGTALDFGGTTSSYPAIVEDATYGTQLDFKLADGSAYTRIRYGQAVFIDASSSGITPNTDQYDGISVTSTVVTAGTVTVAAPSPSTPNDGDQFWIRIKSLDTFTYVWNSIYTGSATQALPTTPTGSNFFDYILYKWNAVSSKWNLLSYVPGFSQ